MKFLILALLLLPAFAEAGRYEMKEGETMEDVALKFDVPVESIVDSTELDRNSRVVFVPEFLKVEPVKPVEIVATSTVTNIELEAKIAELKQLLQLLIQLVEMQNEQKL